MSAFQTYDLPALQIDTIAFFASSSVLYLPFDTVVQPFFTRASSWAADGPAGWVAADAIGTTATVAATRPNTNSAILSFLRTGPPGWRGVLSVWLPDRSTNLFPSIPDGQQVLSLRRKFRPCPTPEWITNGALGRRRGVLRPSGDFRRCCPQWTNESTQHSPSEGC